MYSLEKGKLFYVEYDTGCKIVKCGATSFNKSPNIVASLCRRYDLFHYFDIKRRKKLDDYLILDSKKELRPLESDEHIYLANGWTFDYSTGTRISHLAYLYFCNGRYYDILVGDYCDSEKNRRIKSYDFSRVIECEIPVDIKISMRNKKVYVPIDERYIDRMLDCNGLFKNIKKKLLLRTPIGISRKQC